MYKAIIAIGIAAAACLAVGCGSSGDETAEAAVTKAQFVKEAEAICNKARDGVQDAAAAWEKANGKGLDIETAFMQIIGPSLKREAEELDALAVPPPDEVKVTRMVANLSKGAASLVAEGPAAKSSSRVGRFQIEAKAYGLDSCDI